MVVLLMPLGPPPPPPLLRISLGWVGSIFWRRTVDQPMTGAGGNGQRQYSLWATSLSPVVSISRPLFNRTHVLLPNKTPPNFVACPETPSQNCRKRQSTHRRVGQCPQSVPQRHVATWVSNGVRLGRPQRDRGGGRERTRPDTSPRIAVTQGWSGVTSPVAGALATFGPKIHSLSAVGWPHVCESKTPTAKTWRTKKK